MTTTQTISHSDRHRVVRELFAPRPLIYWLDFGASALIGWACFVVAVAADGLAMRTAAILVAVLGLYRAALFTHELVHLGRDRMKWFRIAWDALCGVPLLVPSFLYAGVHQEHHFRRQYGTPADGEYLPFGTSPRHRIVAYLASHLILPPLMVLRFGVFGPLSWATERSRRFVWERMSSLSIDPGYRRNIPDHVPTGWIVQEALCAFYVWTMAVLVYTGLLPPEFLPVFYTVSVLILVLNALRTLAAHRYAGQGQAMSFEEQLADSVNVTGGFATPLMAPVGLRYHALHHLFPTMPYHNLGKAHRRLMQQLPGDAVYRATLSESVWQALRGLWSSSSQVDKALSVRST